MTEQMWWITCPQLLFEINVTTQLFHIFCWIEWQLCLYFLWNQFSKKEIINITPCYSEASRDKVQANWIRLILYMLWIVWELRVEPSPSIRTSALLKTLSLQLWSHLLLSPTHYSLRGGPERVVSDRLSPNVLAQIEQLKGFSPVWIFFLLTEQLNCTILLLFTEMNNTSWVSLRNPSRIPSFQTNRVTKCFHICLGCSTLRGADCCFSRITLFITSWFFILCQSRVQRSVTSCDEQQVWIRVLVFPPETPALLTSSSI